MADQNEIIKEEHTANGVTDGISEKKAFVEPAISVPVDVLEATTFFQISTTGGIN